MPPENDEDLDYQPQRESDIKLMQQNKGLLTEVQKYEQMGISLPCFAKFKQKTITRKK